MADKDKRQGRLQQKARLIKKTLELALLKMEELISDLSSPEALREELGAVFEVIGKTDQKLEETLDLYLEALLLQRQVKNKKE